MAATAAKKSDWKDDVAAVGAPLTQTVQCANCTKFMCPGSRNVKQLMYFERATKKCARINTLDFISKIFKSGSISVNEISAMAKLFNSDFTLCWPCGELLAKLHAAYEGFLALCTLNSQVSKLREFLQNQNLAKSSDSEPFVLCNEDIKLEKEEIDPHEQFMPIQKTEPNEIPADIDLDTSSLSEQMSYPEEPYDEPKLRTNTSKKQRQIKKSNPILTPKITVQQQSTSGEDVGEIKVRGDSSGYSCKICRKMTKKVAEMRNHLMHEHQMNIIEADFQCKTATWEIQVLKKIVTNLNSSVTSSTSASIVLGSAKCNICGLAFPDFVELRAHLKIHESDKLDKHGTGPGPYTCELCDKKFSMFFYFSRHTLSCRSTKTYKCDSCEETFKLRQDLIKHKYNQHSRKCNVCGKLFINPSKAKSHMNIVHLKVRKFKCTTCHRLFSYKHELQRHIVSIHQGGGNFLCTVCGKVYKHSEGLRLHSRLHYPKSIKKPHKCDLCDKTFAKPSQLKAHKLSHTRASDMDGSNVIVCAHCGKGFKCKSQLTSHQKYHREAEARNVKCPRCNRRYPTKHILKYHLLSGAHNLNLEQAKADAGIGKPNRITLILDDDKDN